MLQSFAEAVLKSHFIATLVSGTTDEDPLAGSTDLFSIPFPFSSHKKFSSSKTVVLMRFYPDKC